MSLEEDILIEKYLKNELSDNEKASFLEKVNTNPEFKTQFILEKQLFESLNEEDWSFIENPNKDEIEQYTAIYKSDDVKKVKNTIEKVLINKKLKKKNKTIFFSLVAASFTLLILSTLFFYQNTDLDALYKQNIALNELPSFVTRDVENSQKKLIKAEKLFKQKNYKEAINNFTQEYRSNKTNSNIFIYLAIAYIELSKYEKAENILDALIKSDLIDAEKGYWYKSLLYIKSKQVDKAKKTLQKIVDNSLYKKEEAIELLSIL